MLLMIRILLIAGVTCTSLFAADAAMFRGNPAHTGVFESAQVPTLKVLKWKFRTGGKVVSSPAVAGGVLFVGSSDHFLYALNTADGSQRWKFKTGGAVTSSPAIDGGLVYFGSRDGQFYAVDTTNGELRWKFATLGERRFTAPGIHGMQPRTETMPDPYDVFLSSPVISGGVVYFGSGDNNVYALDAKNGAVKWTYKTGDVVHASPAVANGTVYIGSWDRNLYALDAATGALKWRFETGDDREIYNQIGIASSAAVMDGTVFVGCRDGQFYAVDAATGTLKWKHDNNKGWTIASPSVQAGRVYFPTSDGTKFWALDAATGKPAFSVENKVISFSSPAITGTIAFFGSSDGLLNAVDLKTGKLVAQFQTDGHKQNRSRWLDANGKMKDQEMYPDSDLEGVFTGLQRMYSLGSILSSPVVVDGVLYVGSTDGNLYAIS